MAVRDKERRVEYKRDISATEPYDGFIDYRAFVRRANGSERHTDILPIRKYYRVSPINLEKLVLEAQFGYY